MMLETTTAPSLEPDSESPRRPWWVGLWAPVALLALLGVFFGPALAAGTMLAPHDGIALNYPLRLLWATVIRHGELPFWNPYNFGGMPFLATMHPGIFFPVNWFFLVLSPLAAWNAVVITAYWTAGLGAYGFGRALTLSRAASFAMATTFMLSGFLVAHLEQLMMIQAAALLPGLLWAVERFRRTLARRYAVAGCVLVALQILVGFPMMVALSLGVAGAYALFRALSLGGRDRWTFLGTLAGAIALAVGLCLFQLLPTLAFIPNTQRDAISYDYLTWHSLHPRQVLMYWFPFLFGGPVSWLSPTRFWGIGPYLVEIIGYMGLGAIALTTVAATRWKSPAVRFWLGVAVVGLVLSFGRYTPLYRLWALLPVVKTMPGAGRHALEVDMAISVLVGYGFEHLMSAETALRRKLAGWGLAAAAVPVALGALVIALVGGFIAARMQPFMPDGIEIGKALTLANPGVWWPLALAVMLAGLAVATVRRPGRLVQAAWVAFLALDLAVFGQHVGWRQTSPLPGAELPSAAPIVPAGEERLLSVASLRFPYDDFAHASALHYALLGALKGERAIGGYDSFYYARYGQLVGLKDCVGMLTDARVWEPKHHYFDLLNLRTLRLDAALADTPTWKARLGGDRWRRLGTEPGVVLFENTRRMPRAWRVSSAVNLTPDEIDARVRGEAPFDPAAEALVENTRPMTVPFTAGPVTAVTRSMNRIELTTDGDGPGLVVLSENFDPGWTASEGPTNYPLNRVDATLMGIEVPSGHHLVTLNYEPPHWWRGLQASTGALVLLLLWALWPRRRRPLVAQVPAASGRSH